MKEVTFNIISGQVDEEQFPIKVDGYEIEIEGRLFYYYEDYCCDESNHKITEPRTGCLAAQAHTFDKVVALMAKRVHLPQYEYQVTRHLAVIYSKGIAIPLNG